MDIPSWNMKRQQSWRTGFGKQEDALTDHPMRTGFMPQSRCVPLKRQVEGPSFYWAIPFLAIEGARVRLQS